jgi:hypothetical protein
LFNTGEVRTLVGQLRAVDTLNQDIAAMTVKMKLKVDNSLMAYELQKYLPSKQFFEMMEHSLRQRGSER